MSATAAAKGLLMVLFLGTMSMMASATDNQYPDDAATKVAEKEESRFLLGTGTTGDTSITVGNEALLLIPLAFLGLLLLGAVVATLFGIGGAGETGATGYGHDSYSTYDVMRTGLNHGYQALETSSYQIARSLSQAAKKYL